MLNPKEPKPRRRGPGHLALVLLALACLFPAFAFGEKAPAGSAGSDRKSVV